MLTRHKIREAAFQTLFVLNANPDAIAETVYGDVLDPDGDQEQQAQVVVDPYLKLLVEGVTEHQTELDEEISAKLKSNWTLSRLSKTDVVILRLALFEINYVSDVPGKVAVNEALELAKIFSDDSSRPFINAVLSPYIESDDQVSD